MVIPLIAEALLRVDPYSAVLTSSHLLLAELSIEAEDYVAALPVLEQPVLYLATASANKPEFLCDLTLAPNAYVTTSLGFSSKLKSVDILSYLMLSAMVFIGSRRWDSALRALENVISFPCKDASVSKIMVEAYKKWLLVGLLHTGGLLPLPRSTTPFAIKAYHTIGKPYEAVAALFDAPTAARFRAEIEFASAQWAEDCNVGLMHELLLAYQKWQIRRLSKTYAKMPVSEVVNLTTSAETGTRLALPAVEAMIREMIDENSLRATMTVSETLGPVLHFDAVDAKLPEEELNVALAQATYRVKALTAEIKTTDRALTQHKSYVEHLVKNRNRKNGARSSFDAGMGGMDMDWNQVIDDEDIMNAF